MAQQHAEETGARTVSSSSSSSSSHGGRSAGAGIVQSHHLVTISHPRHPHFLVSVLKMRDSCFVWCGEAPEGYAAAKEADDHHERGQSFAPASSSPSSSSASTTTQSQQTMEEAALATLSEEDRRQLEVDRQVDEELAQAMQAAGRDGQVEGRGGTSTEATMMAAAAATAPKGLLAQEWAMAMCIPGREPTSTALFRTPADVATPMSRRLARRLAIPQLHLSLSVPQDLIEESGSAGASAQPDLSAGPAPSKAMPPRLGLSEMLALNNSGQEQQLVHGASSYGQQQQQPPLLALESGIEQAVRIALST